MSQDLGSKKNTVYRLVLTGGPCGGKTTGQARLCTFFENLGWKVYRVPECATVLMSGGVKWTELGEDASYNFQENLLKTMMQMENTFFNLAKCSNRNCLVVCDRGTMDASAFLSTDLWDRMMRENGWNNVELRDNRYNQVIHMVSAAKGAEEFYTTEDHVTRYEPVELARELDDHAAQAWVGHPYYDVIDNTTDFENKINRMIASVCNRVGIDTAERLSSETKKRKFLVRNLPDLLDQCWMRLKNDGTMQIKGDEGTCALADAFPQFQDFIVVHDYLVTPSRKMQARIRKRGQNVEWDSQHGRWNLETGNWTYTHTIRRPEIDKQSVELRMQLSGREYQMLLAQRDEKHYTIYKTRKCFLWNNQYFQMDIYQEPCDKRCKGLILLETFTTCKKRLALPDFLHIEAEVTDNAKYSMFNLSMKDNTQYIKHIMNGDYHGNGVHENEKEKETETA